MQALLDVIAPVFLVIGFGYLVTAYGLFSSAAVDGLMSFTQNFAIPCLLFSAIAHVDLPQSFDLRLLVSFYTGSISGFALGLLGARYLFGRDWEDAVAIGFTAMFANSVMLGLPVTQRAYGQEALSANYAIVSLHAPFCYGVGITMMELVRARGRRMRELVPTVFGAMFRNNLVIGIALGFAVNLSGLPVPRVLGDALDLMIRAALPAALFGMGGVLVRYRPDGDFTTIAYVCALTLGLHPLVAWTMGNALSLPESSLRSAVLTAAMAPGINTYVFASIYGRGQRVAASSVLIGTTISTMTVWLWLTALP